MSFKTEKNSPRIFYGILQIFLKLIQKNIISYIVIYSIPL